MEHRGDLEPDLALAHVQLVVHRQAHGLQHHRPVGVDDALRVAGRGAGEAHGCGGFLVEFRELDVLVGVGQELLVRVHGQFDPMLGHRPICVHDDALHAGQAHVQQLCDQVELIDVDEQEPILGLVNRELLLPRRKPQVDRM